MISDYQDPGFHLLFQPNVVTEHRLRELRIPGPPWVAPKKLAIIKELNRMFRPSWTAAAVAVIDEVVEKAPWLKKLKDWD